MEAGEGDSTGGKGDIYNTSVTLDLVENGQAGRGAQDFQDE